MPKLIRSRAEIEQQKREEDEREQEAANRLNPRGRAPGTFIPGIGEVFLKQSPRDSTISNLYNAFREDEARRMRLPDRSLSTAYPPSPTTPPPMLQAVGVNKPLTIPGGGEDSRLGLLTKIEEMRRMKQSDVQRLIQGISQEPWSDEEKQLTFIDAMKMLEGSDRYLIPELEAYKATQAERVAGMQVGGQERVAKIGAQAKEAKPEIELKDRMAAIQKHIEMLMNSGLSKDHPEVQKWIKELDALEAPWKLGQKPKKSMLDNRINKLLSPQR